MKSTGSEPLVIPTGGGLGAEIRGVDLRRLGDDAFAAIHRAWLDNLVLLFRGQQLTDLQLIAFSRCFGELDLAPVQETGRRFVEGIPELYVVSNVLKDGEPIGSLGYGEAVWHTDMSYVPDPPMASMLYALEIPPAGDHLTGCLRQTARFDRQLDDTVLRIDRFAAIGRRSCILHASGPAVRGNRIELPFSKRCSGHISVV